MIEVILLASQFEISRRTSVQSEGYSTSTNKIRPANYFKTYGIVALFILMLSLPISIATMQKRQETGLYAATTSNTTVDFSSPLRTLSPLAFGMDVSGYGMGGVNIVSDQLQRDRLTALHLGLMRIDLKYTTSGNPDSKIICAAVGCDTSKTGDDWVNNIKAVGAEPIMVVPRNVTDATNLVKHFNVTVNNPVKYWIIGNEPDGAGVAATDYANTFNTIYDSMKDVDPSIKIGGPATAWFNISYLQTFLNISGSRTDFVDYHAYGQEGANAENDADLLAGTNNYTSDANTLRTMIQNTVPSRAAQIEIHLGEWNMSWSGDSRLYTNYNTVWSASALGHQLLAGVLSCQYADKNGGIGALYEQNDSVHNALRDEPMPIYHGIGMFTGENLFPSFGTNLVTANTSLPNVEVYASDNPKNIVVINKDRVATQALSMSLTGVSSATVDVWQKNQSMAPIAPPSKLTTIQVGGSSLSYSIPPYSVTTFVLSNVSPVSLVPVLSTNTPTPAPQV